MSYVTDPGGTGSDTDEPLQKVGNTGGFDDDLRDKGTGESFAGEIDPQRIEEIEMRMSELESKIDQINSYTKQLPSELGKGGADMNLLQFQSQNLISLQNQRLAPDMTIGNFGSTPSSPTNSGKSEAKKLKRELYDNPQTVFYAVSIVIMMSGIYWGNPILVIVGGLLLVITGLHYDSSID